MNQQLLPDCYKSPRSRSLRNRQLPLWQKRPDPSVTAGRAGTCHHGPGGGHDHLTNAALAAWFGAFEEPPRMSSRRADDAKQRAAQATEPSIKSAYEKVAEYWMLLARLESLLAAEKITKTPSTKTDGPAAQ
jgi:hypothetical protein